MVDINPDIIPAQSEIRKNTRAVDPSHIRGAKNQREMRLKKSWDNQAIPVHVRLYEGDQTALFIGITNETSIPHSTSDTPVMNGDLNLETQA